jgi:hypothetical protein
LDISIVLDEMKERWKSAIVAREQVDVFSGGAITSKSLANLDSRGEGVQERFRIGRKIVYPTWALVKWLESRSKAVMEKKPKHQTEGFE